MKNDSSSHIGTYIAQGHDVRSLNKGSAVGVVVAVHRRARLVGVVGEGPARDADDVAVDRDRVVSLVGEDLQQRRKTSSVYSGLHIAKKREKSGWGAVRKRCRCRNERPNLLAVSFPFQSIRSPSARGQGHSQCLRVPYVTETFMMLAGLVNFSMVVVLVPSPDSTWVFFPDHPLYSTPCMSKSASVVAPSASLLLAHCLHCTSRTGCRRWSG